MSTKDHAFVDLDDDVVITGMSGRFPDSDSVEELAQNLYAGVDMVTDEKRGYPSGPDVPATGGKLKNLSHFDASYFNVSSKQAHFMDPQLRILLEVVHESIVDAGISPVELRGSRTGVVIAISGTDAFSFWNTNIDEVQGYEIMGGITNMFANRVNYSFDFRGPAFAIDTGCGSSLTALAKADMMLKAGSCDAVVVAATSLTLSSTITVGLTRLGMLSSKLRCQSFNDGAEGYVRSDAMVSLLLQKRRDARRVYSTILGSGILAEGYKPDGASYPYGDNHHRLRQDIFRKSGINPLDFVYVEAHGTGTKAGDLEEVKGITETFGKGRKIPLLIGTIKSNMGHAEAASGLCGVVKVLISMENELIPKNLHFSTPNPNIPELADGRVKVVNHHIPLKGGLVGVNNFGFSVVGHAVLKSSQKPRPLPVEYKVPRLVLASGRTEEAVHTLLALANANKADAELHAMIDAIHLRNNPGHPFRGYALLEDHFSENICHISDNYEGRPLWFAFTGSDSQWFGVKDTLMQLPVFAESVNRSATFLRPHGVNLQQIVIGRQLVADILSATVGLVALHVALVDVLRELEIHPEGIIGYGIGEIGCGYADGSLTAEQAILSAYWCGVSLMETNSINDAASFIKSKLQLVIPKPKPRSAKWISSLPSNDWNNDIGNLCSAEYYAHSLTSAFEFSDVLQKHERAIVLELGPASELASKAVENVSFIPLIKQDGDSCLHLLSAIGNIYNSGAQPHIARLYPQVQWPVSKGTPGLSSHIRWDHSEEWMVPHMIPPPLTSRSMVNCDLLNQDDAFIADRNIGGRILYPEAGYLILVWRTLARAFNRTMEETPVVFENVSFINTVVVTDATPVKFEVNVNRLNNNFEIYEHDKVIAFGTAYVVEEKSTKPSNTTREIDSHFLPLTANDIYKDLKLRGYQYSGLFKGVISSDAHLTTGSLSWNNNWIPFIDTMLQFDVIGNPSRSLFLLKRLQKLSINAMDHFAKIEDHTVSVNANRVMNTITAGGIEIQGIQWNPELKRVDLHKVPKLEKYVYMPYYNKHILKSEDALTACLQLVIENTDSLRLKIAEVLANEKVDTLLLPKILKIIDAEPQIRTESVLAIEKNSSVDVEALNDLNIKVISKDGRSGLPDNECHLLVGTDLLSRHDVLSNFGNLAAAVCGSGFILLKESKKTPDYENRLNYLYDNIGLAVVSQQVTDNCVYILMRRKTKLPKDRIIIDITENYDSWMGKLRVAMTRHSDKNIRIYLISYARDSGLIGLFKSLQKEAGGNKLRVFILPDIAKRFTISEPTFKEAVEKDLVMNILRNGAWGAYRHLLLEDNDDKKVDQAFACALKNENSLCLKWIQSPPHVSKKSISDPKLCNVHYATLNRCDVTRVDGKCMLTDQPSDLNTNERDLGIEFSGLLNGKRVMGIVKSRGLATTVSTDQTFLWEVPSNWSLEDAATVPVAYVKAYSAVVVQGRMQRGESVLIHDGTSDVGIAAITLTLDLGCSVYVTVETNAQQDFLLSRHSELDSSHIGNIKDSSFEELVLQQTSGRGVDVVINSLEAKNFLATIRCLAQGGRFVELSNLDRCTDAGHNLSVFSNKSFHCVQTEYLSDVDKSSIAQGLRTALAEDKIQPLPRNVYSMSQLEEAFRATAQGDQTGKTIIKIDVEDALLNQPETNKIVRRTYMHSDKSYILVGGLGGVGLELGQWLVSRGATRIVFTSRSGLQTGYQSWCVKRLQDEGVIVLILTDDVTTTEGAEAVIRKAAELGPVGGIFNLAGAVREKLFENQSVEDFLHVTSPKIAGTRALDTASRNLAAHLDHFVAFSSVFGGRGVHGQSNYGMANSGMERIVEQRKADGFPALAIQWGVIGEVGMVAEQNLNTHEDGEAVGTSPQPIESCLETLNQLLTYSGVDSVVVVASYLVAEKHIIEVKNGGSDIKESVAQILGVPDISKISDSTTLVELGMDSIMAAAVLRKLEKDYDILITIQQVKSLTFGKLSEF